MSSACVTGTKACTCSLQTGSLRPAPIPKINVSLGKINSFRPFYDKDSNCIRIIDENVLSDSKENEVIEIPNFGTKSLVYDYSFNSKISPKLAAQIVIAAQAAGKDLGDFPEDVLSYASLNHNIKDRLGVTKVPAVPPNKKFVTDIKKQLILNVIKISLFGDSVGSQMLHMYYDLVNCLL